MCLHVYTKLRDLFIFCCIFFLINGWMFYSSTENVVVNLKEELCMVTNYLTGFRMKLLIFLHLPLWGWKTKFVKFETGIKNLYFASNNASSMIWICVFLMFFYLLRNLLTWYYQLHTNNQFNSIQNSILPGEYNKHSQYTTSNTFSGKWVLDTCWYRTPNHMYITNSVITVELRCSCACH